ncbi:hypothetical protein Tco_1185837 [Tanacetum coccineum]
MYTIRYKRLGMVKEDRGGWPSSFLPKWAAKSRGRFISRLQFSSAPAFEGPLPLIFLPILLLSLFEASSNPTTLLRYLQTLGDLVRSGGVTSLRFDDFIVGFYESRTNHKGRISRSGSTISKWRVSKGSGGKHGSSYKWSFSGPMDGATDCANMGTIRLRWDLRVLGMLEGLPKNCIPHSLPWPDREGFEAFAWRIPILVTISKIVLRHLKLFKGFKVQLGKEPIQARRGGLRAGGEGWTIQTLLMEEYIRLEKEKAQKRGIVFNWESAKYDLPLEVSFDDSDDEDYTVIFEKNSLSYKIFSTKDLKTDSENDNEKVMPSLPPPEPDISCFDDLDFFKDFENEFPAIVYNDALTSKSDLLTEPILNPQHIEEFDLKNETSLSGYDEEEQIVLYFNDLFPFNIIRPDDLKSETDNDDNDIDII